MYIYIYILSGCKKRSERFSYVFCADVFPTFLSPFFLRFFLSFFLRFFFVVFSTFFSLVGHYWKAAGLRSPGGLQAGASEVAFLCPNVFSTFFIHFVYVFYCNNSVPTFGGNMPPGWEGGRMDWKGYRFSYVFVSVFPTLFTFVFSTFSCCLFYVF